MAKESSPSDRANRARGCAVGGVVATCLALVFWRNAVADRKASVALALGSVAFVLATAFVGGWAGTATGQRVTGGGVRNGVVSAWISLFLVSLLAAVPDFESGRKHGFEVVGSALALMFFGFVPAALLGALAGLVLSKLVSRPTSIR
jgi:hypothetical protein